MLQKKEQYFLQKLVPEHMASIENNLIGDILNFKFNSKNLIRIDGRINSPLVIRFLDTELYHKIVNRTNFLPKEASFSQRWWHIKNNKFEYKICSCGKVITEWRRKYCRFCSHICAITCAEAQERTRKQFSGKVLSNEQCEGISKRLKGSKHTAETKALLSFKKLGSKNPNFGKIPWNKGLLGIDNPNFGKKRPHAKMPIGINNKQYGKSPVNGAGYGIQGKFNGIYFRSSLELFYLMYWYENAICVESAEQDFFRMTYFNKGKQHTYTPDFYLYNLGIIVEIKPEYMQEENLTQIKFNTLKYYFEDKKCMLLGYRDISEFIIDAIYTNKVDMYLTYCLIIKEIQLQRLKKNYGDILREIKRVI